MTEEEKRALIAEFLKALSPDERARVVCGASGENASEPVKEIQKIPDPRYQYRPQIPADYTVPPKPAGWLK